MATSERLAAYARLMRIDRPIGWLLLLWPTLWAVWIAGEGRPEPAIVVIFVAGVWLMRAAGCIANDYADRDFDRHVKRTRDRPLTSGQVSTVEAGVLFTVLCLAAFSLVSMLNRLTMLLAVAALAIAVLYPFLKRFTHLPQLFLGVAFSWGIPMAFAAQRNELPLLAWVLLAANLCWVVAYDTLYAMVDRDDDVRIGIRSTAILFGRWDRHLVALFHGLVLALLAAIGAALDLGHYYLGGLAVAAGIAAYQLYLCRDRDRDNCFRAFLNNTWFGASVFSGIVLAYL